MSDTSKKYFWIFLDILIAGLIINLVFFVMPMLNEIGNSRFPARTISVTAEGKTTAKPDLAQFSFSVVSEGADLAKIAEENNKRIAEVIKFIKSEGIPEEDIKTTQYSLTPKYEYIESQRKSFISGYQLTQTIFVKIKDLEKNISKASRIIGSLPELGINQISGLSFTFDDPESLIAEARKEAFEKAKDKAKTMAKAAGVRLGRVVNFSDYQGGPIYPIYEKSGQGGDFAGASLAAPAPIETGTEEVTVNVNITYEIR